MHSSRAHEPLWLIGTESNSDSVLQGCAGGSTTSTLVWSRRSVDFTTHLDPGPRRKPSTQVPAAPLAAAHRKEHRLWHHYRTKRTRRVAWQPFLREQSVSRHAGGIPCCGVLHELELDIAFLNEVV